MALSNLHTILDEIEIASDADRLNEIANDETVYPLVRGLHEGKMDFKAVVDDPTVLCLVGEYGAEIFKAIQPGIFEVHSMCLPRGRGRWMVEFVQACLFWVFTRTTTVELLTRCPTIASKALARSIGGVKEFTTPNGWFIDGELVPADIYALRIQDWMKIAPGLEERGQWFHERIEDEYEQHGEHQPPHADVGDDHDRYTGAACEMMLHGQPDKAVVFYNRWAAMAGYDEIKITVRNPLTIDIGGDIMIVGDDDFWMPVCRRAA